MDLQALQIFVAAMRRGSFTQAARDLDMAPSSVSRAIALLERELNFRLFQRSTRKIIPTEAGQAYFQRVQPILEDLARAHHAAADLTERPRGLLRVTASVAFGQTCILPILPALHRDYPDLTIELLLTDAVMDIIAEQIDVAVRLGPLADSNLIARRLMPTRYFLCASPAYLKAAGQPRQPSDITRHSCLVFSLPGFQTRWFFRSRAGARSEVSVGGRTVSSSALALKYCALHDMGLALLPDWLIQDDIAAGRLTRLFMSYDITATHFDTAAWLIYPTRAYVPLKARLFGDYLQRHLTGGSRVKKSASRSDPSPSR